MENNFLKPDLQSNNIRLLSNRKRPLTLPATSMILRSILHFMVQCGVHTLENSATQFFDKYMYLFFFKVTKYELFHESRKLSTFIDYVLRNTFRTYLETTKQSRECAQCTKHTKVKLFIVSAHCTCS